MRRMVCVLAALATLAGTRPSPASAAETVNLCKVYCAAIYVGCRATFGKLDRTICLEWVAGCLDGCEVNR